MPLPGLDLLPPRHNLLPALGSSHAPCLVQHAVLWWPPGSGSHSQLAAVLWTLWKLHPASQSWQKTKPSRPAPLVATSPRSCQDTDRGSLFMTEVEAQQPAGPELGFGAFPPSPDPASSWPPCSRRCLPAKGLAGRLGSCWLASRAARAPGLTAAGCRRPFRG